MAREREGIKKNLRICVGMLYCEIIINTDTPTLEYLGTIG